MIEFLFSNPLLIIILIGFINFLLNSGKKKEEETRKPERKPRQVSTERKVSRQEQVEDAKELFEQAEETYEQFEEKSIDELRQQQLERLSMSLQSNVTEEAVKDVNHYLEDDYRDVVKEANKSHDDLEQDLQGRLTQKGLIDSVIMAEVLGQPRALKPYDNVYTRRINRH